MPARSCDYCGKVYTAQRSTSKFCSATCRSKARHFRQGEPFFLDPAKPDRQLDEREVLSVVMQAHQCASDMSRASRCTQQPLAGALLRVAVRFEDALESEGL